MSNGNDRRYASDIEALKESTVLSEAQILRLLERFKKLDVDCKGSISKTELEKIPGVACNPLVDRVIAVMAKNKSERVTFSELAHALSILSPQKPSEDRLRFAYSIYDVDGDGKVSNADLFTTLKVMVGQNLTEVQVQQIVDRTFIEADLDRDGYITFEDFQRLSASGDFGEKLVVRI